MGMGRMGPMGPMGRMGQMGQMAAVPFVPFVPSSASYPRAWPAGGRKAPSAPERMNERTYSLSSGVASLS